MLREQHNKQLRRTRRSKSVRSRLKLRSDLPRLSVHRTCKHIYAQIIDDAAGSTVVGTGTTAKSMKDALGGKTKTERAAEIGKEIARLAKDKGIETVVFDRGYSQYHGRVKALAEAAREGGLRF